MRTRWIGCAAIALIAALACAQSTLAKPHNGARVTVEAGNVFIVKNGQRRQLTRSGRDFDAALSPDGRFVVYTRGDGKPPPDDPSECRPDQLRRVDVDGRNDRLLLTGYNANEPPRQLCRFEEKQFTADGRKLFFLSPGWTTSAALHVYDIRSKEVRFVAAANALVVLNFCSGKYRDALIVNQHRYFLGGGSYDWYWLFDASGRKEIGPVADENATRKEIVGKARDSICQ